MENEVLGITSLIIALLALLFSLWQNLLTRKTLQAQIFLSMRQYGEDAGYVKGVQTIFSLKNYENYAEFVSNEDENVRDIVFKTVDFLNYSARFATQGLLPRQYIWDLYFWGYRTCFEKLLPWWLDGIRTQTPRRFNEFEKMCKTVGGISRSSIQSFEKKHRHSTTQELFSEKTSSSSL